MFVRETSGPCCVKGSSAAQWKPWSNQQKQLCNLLLRRAVRRIEWIFAEHKTSQISSKLCTMSPAATRRANKDTFHWKVIPHGANKTHEYTQNGFRATSSVTHQPEPQVQTAQDSSWTLIRERKLVKVCTWIESFLCNESDEGTVDHVLLS